MWVDGKLTAHYYGWNLQDIEVDEDIANCFYSSEDNWPTEDLFARASADGLNRIDVGEGDTRCRIPVWSKNQAARE
jgi:hypothetical protein